MPVLGSATGSSVPKSLIDAKGDLIVGTADDTAAKLTAGTNGYALVADSTQTTGLKYAAVRGPSIDNLDDFNAIFGSTYTGHDQEFDATNSTSLPSGWTWQNQGTSTYRERFGAGVVIPSTTTGQWRSIVQSLSGAPSTWDLYCKINVGINTTAAQNEWGILLTDGTIHRVFERVLGNAGSVNYGRIANWPTASSFGSVASAVDVNTGAVPHYFRVRKNSATSFDFYLSTDGRAWILVVAGYNPSTAGAITPTHIGLTITCATGFSVEMSCEWWRLR